MIVEPSTTLVHTRTLGAGESLAHSLAPHVVVGHTPDTATLELAPLRARACVCVYVCVCVCVCVCLVKKVRGGGEW